jgi:hypothetical protein
VDVVNMVSKMAYRRTKISGTINVAFASEFFTQNVEGFTVRRHRHRWQSAQYAGRAAQ